MAKKRTRSTAATRSRRGTGSRRSAKLSSVSTAELQAEIQRREDELLTRRQELSDELEAVEAEMAELGGLDVTGRNGSATRTMPRRSRGGKQPRSGGRAAASSARSGRKRPRNEMNLVEALHELLRGRTMSVTETASAVQKAGYRTTSPNFRTIVNQTLINRPELFKRVARGKYASR